MRNSIISTVIYIIIILVGVIVARENIIEFLLGAILAMQIYHFVENTSKNKSG